MADNHYDPREGIAYAQASRRWATLGILALIVGLLVAVWWFVQSYYGDDGVRITGIVLGLGIVIVAIIGLGVGVMAIATAMAQRHHDNVLSGLVDFQREDDRGEVARTVANGVAGVLKSGNQLDRTVLTMAGRMGQAQAQAIVRGQITDQQRQAQDAQASWYELPSAQFEDDTPAITPPRW